MSIPDPILTAFLADVQAALTKAQTALATPSGIPVGPADNLLSLIAQAVVGQVFLVDPAVLVLCPGLVLSKPVTLLSTGVIPGRAALGMAGPILRGDVTVTAPLVSLIGIRLEGSDPAQTILTTGLQTLVQQCVVLGSAQGQHRGIAANSAGVTVRQSYVANIWASIDAQAVAAWAGCAHLTVDDCYLEASGENLLFGGNDDASAALDCQDIAITNCDLNKPLTWRGMTGLTVKNLIELKQAQRVTISQCRAQNCWVNGQDGYGLVLTVRNQSGGSPWSTLADIVVEDCTFMHLAGGMNILGSDDTYPSGQMARVTIQRNQFTDINPAAWGGNGREILIGGGPQQLSLLGNTFSGVGENSAMTFSNSVPKNPLVTNTCGGLIVSGNTFDEGDYGITGDGAPSLGVGVLNMYAPGYQWPANTIKKGTSGRVIAYPPGTTVV